MNKYLEQLLNLEGITKSEPANILRESGERHSGRLILSKYRLIFIHNDQEEPELDIDLDTINTIKHTEDFVDHNIMGIEYLQYHTARFTVLNYEDWEKAIEELRMKPHI